MPEPVISIVICTYNRADLLRGAVITACDQSADAGDFEMIVVDNNSSDSTAQTVRRLQERFSNLRYCTESSQGLSHARNRGWREARAPWVGYVDDDALIPGGWVRAALAIAAGNPPAGFGGPYYPFYQTERPAWFKDAYGSMSLGDSPRTLGEGEYLCGGNMVWRREVLESLGGFDPRLGVSGGRQGAGEETELQRRLRARPDAGAIFYDPGLHLFHLVRAERMRLIPVLRERFSRGRQAGPALGLGGAGGLYRLGRGLLAAAWHAGLGWMWRDRRRQPQIRCYWYERLAPALEAMGSAWGSLRGGRAET